MSLDTLKLKQIIGEAKVLSEEVLAKAVKQAKAEKKSLENILVSQDLISDEHLGRLIAEANNWQFINLRKVSIPEEVLGLVPKVMAEKQGLIAFAQKDGNLSIALSDPQNLSLVHLMSKKTGDQVEAFYATPRDIKETLNRYHRGLKKEFDHLIQDEVVRAKNASAEDLPIIKIVDTIMQYAYENKTSDVHLEPFKEKIVVRFRIDGILHDVLDLPKDILELIVTRIKILARLRTDEHQAAQDGKISMKIGEEDLDIRVSIIPITAGEKVVLRLLSARARQFTLADLGLAPDDIEKVQRQIKKPTGMVLVTGPTGSGKTTSLYAALKILNRREVNISTIEDPVEYDLEGVNQIQVNPRTELTFAKGLRSIVRQDPDIVMVGEIRDEETAGIAVNAAMTGHLVLSTLHTNDAATTLPRLIDMKIEPFLVASTINVIVAQRLVRKICTQCMASEIISGEKLAQFKQELNLEEVLGQQIGDELRVYRGQGCPVCQNTGYRGRVGVFEILEMSEEIRQLIMQRADADQIEKRARELGMRSMLQDGIQKAMQGVTTIDEVLRIAYI